MFDFASTGRNVVHDTDGDNRTMRHIHHLAMRVLRPKEIAKFYTDVFGLAVAKAPGPDRVQHLTDGVLTFEIMPCFWKLIRPSTLSGFASAD